MAGLLKYPALLRNTINKLHRMSLVGTQSTGLSVLSIYGYNTHMFICMTAAYNLYFSYYSYCP